MDSPCTAGAGSEAASTCAGDAASPSRAGRCEAPRACRTCRPRAWVAAFCEAAEETGGFSAVTSESEYGTSPSCAAVDETSSDLETGSLAWGAGESSELISGRLSSLLRFSSSVGIVPQPFLTGSFHHFPRMMETGFGKPVCRQRTDEGDRDTLTQAPHMDGPRLILLQMTDMCCSPSYTFAERFDRGTDESSQIPVIGMDAPGPGPTTMTFTTEQPSACPRGPVMEPGRLPGICVRSIPEIHFFSQS